MCAVMCEGSAGRVRGVGSACKAVICMQCDHLHARRSLVRVERGKSIAMGLVRADARLGFHSAPFLHSPLPPPYPSMSHPRTQTTHLFTPLHCLDGSCNNRGLETGMDTR